MQMFDEEIATLIKTDGTIEQKRLLTEDTLQAEEMEHACGRFLSAEKKFQQINAQPEAVTDPKLNALWWDSLERVYQREKEVWRLFVGEQPTPEQNKLYANFRKLLLEGGSLKTNA